MTAEIPSIHVYNQTTKSTNQNGMASKIAVIGAFDTLETNPKLFTSIKEAQTTFGTDVTYNGCVVIEDLFEGASSLLAVNITTESSGTRSKTINAENLAAALAKIKGEDFDILFVADTLSDTLLAIVTEFLDDCFEMKMPAGYVGLINGASSAANVATAALAGDHCYGMIPAQKYFVNGTSKPVLRTAAYYAGLLAGMNVGNTMTMKVVPGVTGVDPEFTFETGDDGKAYVEAGLTIVKCQDRNNNRYVVVNSEQPNGYDLYINRVRDYVVKQMALHQFLGERNRQATIEEIGHELAGVKDTCVDSLDLLEDINYTIEKETDSCVGVTIDSLLFAGIITRINVYVRLEVE